MKAVKFVMVVMFVWAMTVQSVMAQENAESMADSLVVEEVKDEAVAGSADEGAVFAESAVKPYEGFLETNEQIADQVDNMTSEDVDQAQPMIEAVDGVAAEVMDEVKETAETVEEPAAVVATEAAAEAVAPTDSALLEAVKADIKERSKTTGRLDLYDGSINKVRTLDLIDYKPETTQDGDTTVVRGDFRDTSTGDVVSLDIKVVTENGAYGIKDMVIASVKAPELKEAKSEYTDDEVKAFMQEYIDTQSQATGTFDLYDEKAKKMRNLQFVSLDEKLRRYGIIAIATAEFTDKSTGDVIKVDVNTENKNGLSVTAMRLKSVSKPAVKE